MKLSICTVNLPTRVRVTEQWEHHGRSDASVALSVSITHPWAVVPLKPCPLLFCTVIVFLPLLPAVSGSWQLVSITVIPQALACVQTAAQQQVQQQRRDSLTHCLQQTHTSHLCHVCLKSNDINFIRDSFALHFLLLINFHLYFLGVTDSVLMSDVLF